MRAPSPADIRCDLDPAVVDALAEAYHLLHCRPLAGPDVSGLDDHHMDGDRGRARFMLMSLRDAGWRLTQT